MGSLFDAVIAADLEGVLSDTPGVDAVYTHGVEPAVTVRGILTALPERVEEGALAIEGQAIEFVTSSDQIFDVTYGDTFEIDSVVYSVASIQGDSFGMFTLRLHEQ